MSAKCCSLDYYEGIGEGFVPSGLISSLLNSLCRTRGVINEGEANLP